MIQKSLQTASESISHLSGEILFSLARNPSASKEYRKAAVEFLIDRYHYQANDPELSGFVAEIEKERAAREEVQDVVETAIEAPIPIEKVMEGIRGALQASVTTATLFGPEIVQNPNALSDDALAEDEPIFSTFNPAEPTPADEIPVTD